VKTLKDVPIARVAAGLDHSLVLNDKGDTIYACGKAGYGQLGIPEDRLEQKHDSRELEGKGEKFVTVPLRVSFPQTDKLDKIGRFVDIFCGENHSGAITSAGKIYTWGYGEYGQAGNDPTIHTDDLKQPRLNEDWLKDTELCVHQGSGGSQHTLIVASRCKKTT
jgi:alpha-tubulin suppressor-like RCC1 family protein